MLKALSLIEKQYISGIRFGNDDNYTKLERGTILSAERQVVDGTNYRINLELVEFQCTLYETWTDCCVLNKFKCVVVIFCSLQDNFLLTKFNCDKLVVPKPKKVSHDVGNNTLSNMVAPPTPVC